MLLWKKLLTEKEWQTEKCALFALIAGFILTSGAHYFSQRNIAEVAAANELRNERYELVVKLRAAESHLLAMESQIQTFLLTKEPTLLRTADRQLVQAQQQVAELEALLLTSPIQQTETFLDFQKKFREKAAFSNELLDALGNEDQEMAAALLSTPSNAAFTEALHRMIDALFGAATDTATNQRRQEIQDQHQQTLLIDNLAYLLGVGLLVFALLCLLYGLRKHMHLQQHLIEAKEAVEQSAQIKEQFLANMSHEIRTPLQAILGYTNLLGKEKLTTKQSQYVQDIQSAGENLLHIVTDILDVSKIESGMIRLENIPFSLSSLLHSVDNLFLTKAREKGIHLKLHPNPRIPDLLIGDPVRLTQILVNLIDNAIKFTAEGGIDIYTEVVKQTPAQLRLKVSVQDSGTGIAPEQLTNIFERFEQADANVTRLYGGSGLGLFIVKEFVELQKGCVYVESEVGQGSIFSFEIPYGIGGQQIAYRNADFSRIALNDNFGSASILLVEDNPLNQRVVGTFLAEQGLDYDLADNGKSAILRLEQKQYDLILMDVQMPELDGYSATEYIRENMGLRTPIIAMTAHALAGEREKALSHGMDDYLAKPIKTEDLFQLIARFVPLTRNKISRSPAGPPLAAPKTVADSAGLNIDYNFLLESSQGKKEYLRSILELFLQQAPREMEGIEQALRAGQAEIVALPVTAGGDRTRSPA